MEYARRYDIRQISDDDTGLPGMPSLNRAQKTALNEFLAHSPGGWVESPETRNAMLRLRKSKAPTFLERKTEEINTWLEREDADLQRLRKILRYLRDKW
jgi:hypothetical protein